jgi:hypothetical protein
MSPTIVDSGAGAAAAAVDAARHARAIAAFDAANAADPRLDPGPTGPRPRELLHAERVSAMLERFMPGAGEALRLAARGHHVERWTIPREHYPATREGYHAWRTRLKGWHGERCRAILAKAGYDAGTIERVRTIVERARITADPDQQALEDAITLVFLESELPGFVAQHADYDAARLAAILGRTARKMSATARAFATASLALDAACAPLVREAMSEPPASESRRGSGNLMQAKARDEWTAGR